MAEGRTEANYKDDRSIYLDRPDMWTTGKEIREAMEDKEAIKAVKFFHRYDEMGMPFGAWARCPNPCVEIVETLAPIRDLYAPRLN